MIVSRDSITTLVNRDLRRVTALLNHELEEILIERQFNYFGDSGMMADEYKWAVSGLCKDFVECRCLFCSQVIFESNPIIDDPKLLGKGTLKALCYRKKEQ